MGHSQLKIVGGVAVVGLLAALPFARREPAPSQSAVPAASSPALNSVPLYLPAETTSSPAIGLRDQDQPLALPPALVVAATNGKSRLEDNGMPPEMPGRYQPLLDGPPPTLPVQPRALRMQETSLPGSDRRDAVTAPQTHRVVDGDTLARLAQRYWQDASLADELFAANRQVLKSPDPLPIGAVLLIPTKPVKARVKMAPQDSQVELLPAPVRQPTAGIELDEPLVPINR